MPHPPAVTDAHRQAFRDHGYTVIHDVLGPDLLARARAAADTHLAQDPPEPGHLGHLSRWPRFTPDDRHPLLELYHAAGIAELAAGLLRPGLTLDEPDFAQLAVTIPPWPHRPGGPHLDGLTPPPADGVPGTFSLLAGLWLSDQTREHHGNLWVWPGTHLKAGAHLAEHGPDTLTRLEDLGPGPYPKVELGPPAQACGPTGAVVFAHYLLAHNIGGHDGPADAERRTTVYYRLSATGHRRRWRTCVTEPLHEFR